MRACVLHNPHAMSLRQRTFSQPKSAGQPLNRMDMTAGGAHALHQVLLPQQQAEMAVWCKQRRLCHVLPLDSSQDRQLVQSVNATPQVEKR